jgi:hypothetical protein
MVKEQERKRDEALQLQMDELHSYAQNGFVSKLHQTAFPTAEEMPDVRCCMYDLYVCMYDPYDLYV